MNKKLIQALQDARAALYGVGGIELEGIRGPGQLDDEMIDEELALLDAHIEALKKA